MKDDRKQQLSRIGGSLPTGSRSPVLSADAARFPHQSSLLILLLGALLAVSAPIVGAMPAIRPLPLTSVNHGSQQPISPLPPSKQSCAAPFFCEPSVAASSFPTTTKARRLNVSNLRVQTRVYSGINCRVAQLPERSASIGLADSESLSTATNFLRGGTVPQESHKLSDHGSIPCCATNHDKTEPPVPIRKAERDGNRSNLPAPCAGRAAQA